MGQGGWGWLSTPLYSLCPLGGQRLIGRAGLCAWGLPASSECGQDSCHPVSDPAAPPSAGGALEGWRSAEGAPPVAPGALTVALIAARQSPSPYYYD